jgi:glycosyltransferase involved in cell wall biosynthesis
MTASGSWGPAIMTHSIQPPSRDFSNFEAPFHPGNSLYAMTGSTDHICVCICTFQRTQLLQRLLEGLRNQSTDGKFTYSIVVVDNDRSRTAEPVVADFARACSIPIRYFVEAQQNIAMARNKAVENADGNFVAFIDDDEFPIGNWLLTLFETCRRYGVAGVLGPVNPHFDEEPPQWVRLGKFWQRPTYPTGTIIDGMKGRTGNVLLKKELFPAGGKPFRPEFRAGEDQDFFTRMIEQGHTFIWCNEAVAYEVVPPMRWKRSFILKRSLFLGSFSTLQQKFGASEVARSVIAVPFYTVILPFAAIMGHHKFMTLLSKLAYHFARIMALLGIQVIKSPYVTG